jgi:excinuclease ABC subunit B
MDNRPWNLRIRSMQNQVIYVSATPADWWNYKKNRWCCRAKGFVQRDYWILAIVTPSWKPNDVRTPSRFRRRACLLLLWPKEWPKNYINVGLATVYIHICEVEALERIEIMQDLRKGIFDVLMENQLTVKDRFHLKFQFVVHRCWQRRF